jgi:hypothetical protein
MEEHVLTNVTDAEKQMLFELLRKYPFTEKYDSKKEAMLASFFNNLTYN